MSTKLEISNRLKESIKNFYRGSRGMYTRLEKQSGIPKDSWKNFLYGRQQANERMVEFWCEKIPSESRWLIEGKFVTTLTEANEFLSKPKKSNTLKERFIWVLQYWASPVGADLHEYLEQRSKGSVSSYEWEDALEGDKEITVPMLQVIAIACPMFVEWLLVRDKMRGNTQQVNPEDDESIAKWAQNECGTVA